MAMEQIGKYKIIKELGAGGFGAVYLAEDPMLGSKVAIKVFQVKDENLAGLVTSSSQDATGILQDRFLSEARTLEGLSHNPYVVNLKDFDEMPDGTPYYVMPYLPNSLENEIGKDAFTRGKLEDTPKELHPRKLASSRALEILKQILEGMSEVHKAGLIHRDIKPANILFDSQGNVQICDFGIAKLPDTEHSQSGVGMGSRNYMSPEQRESAKHVSPASDVYSIGVLAYRILTGQLPRVPYESVIEFSPSVGQPLSDLIEMAMSQQEEKRPADGDSFLKQFKQAIGSVGVAPPDTNNDNVGGTATWVGGENLDIRPELKPLEEALVRVLRQEGCPDESQLAGVKAMAMVIGLGDAEINAFIERTEKTLEKELFPYRNWIKLVQMQAQKDNGILSDSSKVLLLQAGTLLNKVEGELLQRIQSLYAKTGMSSDAPLKSAATKWQKPKEYKEETLPVLHSTNHRDKIYKVGNVEFMMKAIPGGRFLMGGSVKQEQPIHEVAIAPFYMLETPVTMALIDSCLQQGLGLAEPSDEGWGRNERPAINISYNDIITEILPWLNSGLGTRLRLPSEAEWEYACRAGTTCEYSQGENINETQARFGGFKKEKPGLFNFKRYGTVPVKQYAANPFGLYDMHGNVWEWVQDSWNEGYLGAPEDGSAWMREGFGKAVRRGGSWLSTPNKLFSSYRNWRIRSDRHDTIGFRFAMDL